MTISITFALVYDVPNYFFFIQHWAVHDSDYESNVYLILYFSPFFDHLYSSIRIHITHNLYIIMLINSIFCKLFRAKFSLLIFRFISFHIFFSLLLMSHWTLSKILFGSFELLYSCSTNIIIFMREHAGYTSLSPTWKWFYSEIYRFGVGAFYILCGFIP